MDRATNRLLVAKARTQHGLLEPNDLPSGLTLRDLLRTELWQEALPDVVCPAACPLTRETREAAAMLWPGRVVLSHFSAARHNGIWVPDDPRAWISVEHSSTKRDLPGLKVVRTKHLSTCQLDGILRWTPARRTVVDLASHLTRKQLEAVLLSAIRVRATTAADVAAAAVGLERRRGMSNLWALLGLWSPERETMLEGKLYDDVVSVVPYGVERQWKVTSADGSRRARVDVAVPELRLAFEADGLYFHSTDPQIASDQHRDRWMSAEGWLTVRFREGVLDDQLGVRRDVRAIVERRRQDLRAA